MRDRTVMAIRQRYGEGHRRRSGSGRLHTGSFNRSDWIVGSSRRARRRTMWRRGPPSSLRATTHRTGLRGTGTGAATGGARPLAGASGPLSIPVPARAKSNDSATPRDAAGASLSSPSPLTREPGVRLLRTAARWPSPNARAGSPLSTRGPVLVARGGRVVMLTPASLFLPLLFSCSVPVFPFAGVEAFHCRRC